MAYKNLTMKILFFIVLSAYIALACGVFVPPRPGHRNHHLLGEKECTYGPSYWCQNLTNAAGCRATKHCIQTVWIHKEYPEDKTSICDTCKEMVKEARDQLESNETQELIKEVFEGSCALLRIKPIVEECDKIADDYIPELIDTLASEMNPQTVCAVAGLCNNPRIHKLLEEAGEQASKKPSDAAPRNRCEDCNTVLDIVVDKFNSMKKDDFLEYLLEVCGRFGTFSDACSNTVVTYFSEIYSYLQENFNANDFCLLSGECFANFHKHDIEITPMSKIGYVPVASEKDDLPCELCEQLVTHLREVLVANTTEAEFKQVLEGICKQTKSFREECLSIVDQYYSLIYDTLVNELNPTAACRLIGICPNSVKARPFIAPLLPVDTAETAVKLQQNSEHVYIPKDDIVIKVMQPKQENPILSAQDMQLPIDLLVPPHQQMYNQQFCVFCEYFLHFVQKEITDPTVEDEVKKVIDKACSKLPKSVNETCIEFVNTYEPALVAVLAQEVDPSVVCPMIHACPKDDVKDVEIFLHTKSSSQCPLCLFAVTELEAMIKGSKSKDEIKAALDKVCSRLPGNLKPECTDFVNTYTDELIEMLIADFKPQEVCVFLKLCSDTTPVSEVTYYVEQESYGGDIETNAIYDDTVNGHPIQHHGSEECILCEFAMEAVEKELKDKKTDDEIKSIVHGICKILPGTIKTECNSFVDQYADAVIILLQEAMDPKSICSYIGCCKKQHPLEFVREEISNCGVCRSAANIVQTILSNPKIDKDMNHIFEKTCRGVSSEMKKTCENITKENGIAMVALFARGDMHPDSVCRSLSYCSSTDHLPVIN